MNSKRLSELRYKGHITDSEYKELKLALRERPTGYWKDIGVVTWHGCTAFECSNCHKCDEREETEIFVPFCKYCGAIMRERGRE